MFDIRRLISDPAPRDATRVFFKQRDWGTHTHVEGYKRANGKRQAQGKHKASTRFQAHLAASGDYASVHIGTPRSKISSLGRTPPAHVRIRAFVGELIGMHVQRGEKRGREHASPADTRPSAACAVPKHGFRQLPALPSRQYRPVTSAALTSP